MGRERNRATVVAMTIAEVFLLLTFVVWLGTVIQSDGGNTSPDITIAMLREEIAELKHENASLKSERDSLKAEIAALKIMVQQWENKYNAATRGAPKCVEDNVLIDASAINGSMSVI